MRHSKTKFRAVHVTISWIFPGKIWGRILAPSQFKNEQKLPKIVYIIPDF